MECQYSTHLQQDIAVIVNIFVTLWSSELMVNRIDVVTGTLSGFQVMYEHREK